MTKTKLIRFLIQPEEEDERAREFNFPVPLRPDFVKSIISFSGSNFRSQSTSKDCDNRTPTLDDATLSLENDESKLILHFSFVESTVVEGLFVRSTITGGGSSALDSFQQHLATMLLLNKPPLDKSFNPPVIPSITGASLRQFYQSIEAQLIKITTKLLRHRGQF